MEEFRRCLDEYCLLKNLVVIKHIPHASLDFPKGYLKGIYNDSFTFQQYNLKMSDVGVDQLFKGYSNWLEIKAKYSRLYCDVERYKDDSKEIMSKSGQGFIYTKFYDGTEIKEIDRERKRKKKEEYYDNYHLRLSALVNSFLLKGKDVLLLDIHSYSEEQANHLGKKGPYKDICIGTVKEYFSQKIFNLAINKIQQRGLSYQVDYPYSGSMVPNNLYSVINGGHFYTLMLEINKRVYL